MGGVFGFMLALAVAAPAAADPIYVTKDADGNLIFTDSPTGDEESWKAVGREPAPINPYLDYEKQEGKFDALIVKYAKKYRLDPFLIKAMMKTESHFDPQAISSAGAHGLMQLMPKTAERYGVKDMFNPEQNIAGGARYLRDLLLMFDGDLSLAVASYNCGEKLVMQTQSVPDIPETRDYVRKVLDQRKEYLRLGFSAQTIQVERTSQDKTSEM